MTGFRGSNRLNQRQTVGEEDSATHFREHPGLDRVRHPRVPVQPAKVSVSTPNRWRMVTNRCASGRSSRRITLPSGITHNTCTRQAAIS